MIHLLPPGSLDHSLLTSIVVGLLIMWRFQEAWGWNFSGLVVPGYLAAVLVLQPETGAIIVVEAVLTYAVVYAISEWTPWAFPLGRWFGRDRFFTLLLASVTIRLLVEAGGLAWLVTTYNLPISPVLHSMGMLVVPLAANALWRTGISQGVTRLGIPILLTWLALRLVLLPITNLSFNRFELIFDDLALDFVSAPKAYLLLLFGAFIGSQFNRTAGWDYGGIIVPGLLAVCWTTPIRVFSTVTEAIFVALMVAFCLRLPGIRGRDWGGARLIVFAFVLSYTIKFVLEWTTAGLWPSLRVQDLYGFGYLLPTLMGLRVYKHANPFHSLLPSLSASIMAFVSANLFIWLTTIEPPENNQIRIPSTNALLLAAYNNEGPMPSRNRIRATTYLTGGQGFGALLRLPGTSSWSVTTVVGEAGLASRASEVASMIGAHHVHLCGSEGVGCERARDELHRMGRVLYIKTSTSTRLFADADSALSLPVHELSTRFSGLTMAAGDGKTILTLSPRNRFALSGPPAREHSIDQAELFVSDNTTPPTNGERLLARSELFQAALMWSEGVDEALHDLHLSAKLLGYDLTTSDDRLIIRKPSEWMEFHRHGTDRVIYTPNAAAVGMLPLSLAAADSFQSAVVLVDAPGGLDDEPTHRLTFQALIAAFDAFPEAKLVTINDMGDYLDYRSEVVVFGEEPDKDTLLSLPVWHRQEASWGDFDSRFALRAPWHWAAELNTGSRGAGIWASTRARARLGTIDSEHPLFASLAPLPSTRLVRVGVGSRAPLPWARAPLSAILDYARSPSFERKQMLVEDLHLEQLELVVGCAPGSGCRWLGVERCLNEHCEQEFVPVSPVPSAGVLPWERR